MRAIYAVLLVGISTPNTLGIASAATILDDVQKACSGVVAFVAKNGTGTIDINDYELKVTNAGKDVDIYQQGVLIQKIETNTATAYYDCLETMTKLMLKTE